MKSFTVFQAKINKKRLVSRPFLTKNVNHTPKKFYRQRKKKMFKDSEKFTFKCTVANWKKEIELRTQEEKFMFQKTCGKQH